MKQTKNILKAIALPPKKRARLLMRVAKNIATVSKSNITKQQNKDGKKWAKRKKGRVKRKAKMLLGLRAQIGVSTRSNEKQAIVSLKKGNYRTHAGSIGKYHSDGNSRSVQANKNYYKRTQPEGCSRAQAKTLKAFGYKISARRMNSSAPRGKRKVPSIKFMMANFSKEEVQGAFFELRNAGAMPANKRRWTIKTPSRRFLGADKEKTAKAWARAFQSIHYGKRR